MSVSNATIADPLGKLKAKDPDLTKRVELLIKELEKQGARDGAKRLAVVAQQFQDFTVEGAYQYIRWDEIFLELEEKSVWWLGILNLIRDFLSIAPIAFTWLALHLAADAYQKDLSDPGVSAKDLYQPFLLLWQEGFHGNHGIVIPFSIAAAIDAALLAFLILMFVFIIPSAKRYHRANINKSLSNFHGVIDDLLALIGREGANALLSDRDLAKIGGTIQRAMNDFLVGFQSALTDVLRNYDRVAVQSGDLVKKTTEQAEKVLTEFQKDLGLFNQDVQLLTTNLDKMQVDLKGHDQRVQALTDASNRLADSSNDLATNAKELGSSAGLSAKASQSIGDRLKDLNTTQQEIVRTQQQVADTIQQTQTGVAQTLAANQQNVYQEIVRAQKDVVQEITSAQQQVVQEVTSAQQNVVQKIESTQKDVVKELTGAADVVERSGRDTRDASLNLERVASNLEQLTRADFQAMTDSVKQSNQDLVREVQKTISEITKAADEAKRVATNLSQFDAYLSVPTRKLTDAANQLNSAAAGLPQLQQPLQELADAARVVSASTQSLTSVAKTLATAPKRSRRSGGASRGATPQSAQQNPPQKKPWWRVW